MRNERGLRGDYFIDRLGGWTEVVLALASLGIVLARFKKDVLASDVLLACLYVVEIVGAVAITRSKLPLMRVAFVLFLIRVFAGLGYMSVIHGDKLARSTLGFPLVVAVYCFARVRSLKTNP